jgi:hypothetical protein
LQPYWINFAPQLGFDFFPTGVISAERQKRQSANSLVLLAIGALFHSLALFSLIGTYLRSN